MPLPIVMGPAALAASDVAGPVLVSSTVTPLDLNIAAGPATTTVTVQITDATGTAAPTLTVGHDATGQSQGFGSMALVSGTPQDGTWERSITIPQGAATGAWTVTLYPLRDTIGNNGTGFQTLATLNVTGTASDVAGPVLVSSTVTPLDLNIAAGPATTTVTVQITDATGTAAPTLTVGHDATGQSQGFGSMALVSGTPQDGTWERSITIPQGAATGAWTVTLYPLRDTIGNNGTGFQTLATLNVMASTSPATLIPGVPVISGSPRAGYTLTAAPGTWSPAPVTLSYQWYRTGIAIPGATASTYKLTTSDIGKTITVRVIGRKTGYTALGKTSTPTAAITGTLTAPVPTITGTTKVGYTLTATPGTWSPAPVTLTYQWYRAGIAITGAATTTHKLTATDAGKPITVRVIGRKTGYTALGKTSTPTAAITGTLTAPVPTITGTTKVGYTLTATPGTWSPAPVTLTYQWYRAGIAITGAATTTHKLTATDAGKPITVRVIGRKTGYTALGKTSTPSASVSP
ncbi:hypothetical protein M1E17_14660 [Arthrobacter sp. D1-29]